MFSHLIHSQQNIHCLDDKFYFFAFACSVEKGKRVRNIISEIKWICWSKAYNEWMNWRKKCPFFIQCISNWIGLSPIWSFSSMGQNRRKIVCHCKGLTEKYKIIINFEYVTLLLPSNIYPHLPVLFFSIF